MGWALHAIGEFLFLPVETVNYEMVVAAVGLSQAIISVSLIFATGGIRSQVQVSLAALVIAYGLTFADSFLLSTGLYGIWPPAWSVVILGYFFIGPCLYLYANAVIHPGASPYLRRLRLHLVTPCLALLLQIPMLMAPEPVQVDVLFSLAGIPLEGGRNFETAYADGREILPIGLGIVLTLFLFFSQTLFYLVWTLRRLQRHLGRARDFFSNIEDVSLSWLRYLVLGMMLLWLGSAARDMVPLVWPVELDPDDLFPILELVVLYVLILKGVGQRAVFASEDGGVGGDGSEVEAAKYAKSALDEARMDRIAQKLEKAMRSDRLYEDSTLTLADLCHAVGASQNHVSQTLNQKLGTKFFDYVARYRIEAAQALLRADEGDQTILDIALSVGFNSKSTFNAAFKRVTGQTPSDYRASAVGLTG